MNYPDGDLEKEILAQGYSLLAGADEAGRGPLAGPLIAAAVIFKEIPDLPLRDSKLCTPAQREKLFAQIKATALAWAFGVVSVKELNRLNNMHKCALLAMQRAVLKLKLPPDFLLIDGKFKLPGLTIPQKALVKGDNRSLFIAAASILAKVKRDEIMVKLDKKYPGFGFARHKGYGTREHFKALEKLGPSLIHRKNFTLFKSQEQLWID